MAPRDRPPLAVADPGAASTRGGGIAGADIAEINHGRESVPLHDEIERMEITVHPNVGPSPLRSLKGLGPCLKESFPVH